MAAEEGGEFEAPTVEHSFFFDKIGDGSVIASVKAMVLLVLGVILVMAFFLAASRKASMMPSKLQFAGESAYGFVRNGVAIEILGGHYGRKWAGFLLWAFFYLLVAGVLVAVFLRFTSSTMWAVAVVGFMLAYMTLMGWWTSRSLGEKTKDDF
jgi:F-type H+-transporting ATPase subunit a